MCVCVTHAQRSVYIFEPLARDLLSFRTLYVLNWQQGPSKRSFGENFWRFPVLWKLSLPKTNIFLIAHFRYIAPLNINMQPITLLQHSLRVRPYDCVFYTRFLYQCNNRFGKCIYSNSYDTCVRDFAFHTYYMTVNHLLGYLQRCFTTFITLLNSVTVIFTFYRDNHQKRFLILIVLRRFEWSGSSQNICDFFVSTWYIHEEKKRQILSLEKLQLL